MRLVGQYDSPFVRRVAIALLRYELAYEHVPWSVWADAEKIAPLSPLRRVPVLVLDEGTALVESFAILDYLDELAGPERALIARSGELRREALRVAALAVGLADKAVSLLYEHVLRASAESPVWVGRCTTQIRETLAVLERDLSGRTTSYWFGASLGHADVAVACTLRFISEAHPALASEAIGPKLSLLAATCEALPEFQKAVQPLTVAVSR